MKQLRAVGQVTADQVVICGIAPSNGTGTGCTTPAMRSTGWLAHDADSSSGPTFAKRLRRIPSMGLPTHGIPASGTRRAQEPPT